MDLLNQIVDFENLNRSFVICSRGKRKSLGYQNSVCTYGEKLIEIRKNILNGSYTWGSYRELIVKDPKTRLILAAPFMDRVVHTAIHRIIEPIFENHLLSPVYACRKGKGNRYAAIDLLNILKLYGKQRYVVKLDIKKYFNSIHHDILLRQVYKILPDRSIDFLILSLLQSYPPYTERKQGIPIGNLSSQLFANFYLSPVDKIATEMVDNGFYFRYMDDMVIGGKYKSNVLDTVERMMVCSKNQLKLEIPFEKKMHFGNGPIPFLGYLLDHTGYKVLSRNNRRHQKRINRLIRSNARQSEIAIREISFNAFAKLI